MQIYVVFHFKLALTSKEGTGFGDTIARMIEQVYFVSNLRTNTVELSYYTYNSLSNQDTQRTILTLYHTQIIINKQHSNNEADYIRTIE